MAKIKIDGEIGWDTTARDVAYELSRVSGDLTVEISSPGGSVFQGIEIYNALRDYQKGSVHVVITSLAASIASYIALVGDTVAANDNAVFMIHNASVMAWGDHNELRKKADIVAGLSGIIAKKYIEVTGKSEKEITKMMDDETFFYGSEMVTAGFVHSIVQTEEQKDATGAKALAYEQFQACLKGTNTRYKDEDFIEAAALLISPTPVEEPTPIQKEGIDNEVHATAGKVNAIKARLKTKEKEYNE